MSNRTLYGGQAVIEGVMIRGRTQAAVTVRKASGDIVRHAIPLESWSKNRARQLPLARGVLVLLETLIMGMKALTFSANEAVEDPDDPSGSSESGVPGYFDGRDGRHDRNCPGNRNFGVLHDPTVRFPRG